MTPSRSAICNSTLQELRFLSSLFALQPAAPTAPDATAAKGTDPTKVAADGSAEGAAGGDGSAVEELSLEGAIEICFEHVAVSLQARGHRKRGLRCWYL